MPMIGAEIEDPVESVYHEKASRDGGPSGTGPSATQGCCLPATNERTYSGTVSRPATVLTIRGKGIRS